MKRNIDDLFHLIDEVLPPQDNRIAQEIHQIIVPQLAFIATQSALLEQSTEYNLHHLVFPRRDYVTPLEKRFRKQLIVPVDIGVHKSLHHELPPPVKPNRFVMLGFLALVDKMNP